MPKAILELELPESCAKCTLLERDISRGNYCAYTKKHVNNWEKTKPADCPLKLVEEKEGCEECNGVAGMELPLSAGIQKVYYCPMCGRKLGDE